MLETLCRKKLYDKCQEIDKGEAPLVWLKGKPRPRSEFEGFYNELSPFTTWRDLPLAKVMSSPKQSLLRMSWQYVSSKSDVICRAFFFESHQGDVRMAMRSAGTFENLYDIYLEWFNQKRSDFMADVTQMIISLRKGLEEQGVSKNPKIQSYGGVASLIKELSNTMKQQGANIRSIAQMQYLVCLQDGIYIPEEFITDVLVASNIDTEMTSFTLQKTPAQNAESCAGNGGYHCVKTK